MGKITKMVYILGTEIKNNAKVEYGLSDIFGIGRSRSKEICRKFGITSNARIKDLNSTQLKQISEFVKEKFVYGDDLHEYLKNRAVLEKKLKTYKSTRIANRLPRRGQRTHTNAK